jgi:hypothetical protein
MPRAVDHKPLKGHADDVHVLLVIDVEHVAIVDRALALRGEHLHGWSLLCDED